MENLMTVVCESKGSKKHRRSERKVPFLSGEEMVLGSTVFSSFHSDLRKKYNKIEER
jgi:hypothetical protein